MGFIDIIVDLLLEPTIANVLSQIYQAAVVLGEFLAVLLRLMGGFS
jgi:hypothetical protein